jgi:hypothetical protein
MLSSDRTGVAIIGGGPAGLATLLAAHRRGRLADLLKEGVTVVEQSGAVGEGSIGSWCINSDSTGFTFADCLAGSPGSELAALRSHPLTKEFLEVGEGTVPLRRAGEFLALVGQATNEVVASSRNGLVLKRYKAISTQRTGGGWLTRIRDLETGRERTIDSQNVVLATGASQPADRLQSEVVAGVNLVERFGRKLLQSGDVLNQVSQPSLPASAAWAGLHVWPSLAVPPAQRLLHAPCWTVCPGSRSIRAGSSSFTGGSCAFFIPVWTQLWRTNIGSLGRMTSVRSAGVCFV